jgi:Phage portal protein, SPP1 Gp6-like
MSGGMDFSPPSYRAASSDLTISISPLGLVELADEEFEVHGPRLNRYSLNWAMYLGHHWSYRRETGETQMVYNYYRAFTDYIINFTFGRGAMFRSPVATEAIVPDLLKRVWEIDNDKHGTLWEMGQQGGVSGDCFVKVAYEEAYEDSTGRLHPGRVRILPLNSSFAFPEFHPHDRSRLIRFKLKYRFWGTSVEGTRQVYTYTEILTDDRIEEYINDELIDSRPNPIGVVPIIHIPNVRVSGSPWGLSDCHDIIVLNRNYNEVATDIADIINYHAAPVTVITGAKASGLEKGPKKVWGGLPKDAQVFNLEGGGQGLVGAMEYLKIIKTAMHEMVGVPETALGQVQPISNTSGVALSIQYQPLMNRYQQKLVQYGEGIRRINELVLLTLAFKEPEVFTYNPDVNGPIKAQQLPQLNLLDPLTYESIIHFPPPLPLDKLIVLNEIQQKMNMQLESREGALRQLGEEFPDEKLEEIRAELIADAKSDGALNLIKQQINSAITSLTGMMPDGTLPPGANPGDGTGPGPLGQPGVITPFEEQTLAQMQSELVTKAYGTKLPQREMGGSQKDSPNSEENK